METGRKRTIWVILMVISGILLVSLWFNLRQLGHKKKVVVQNTELTTENVSLDSALKDARSEINKYKGLSGSLDTVIQEANHKISEKEEKIATLISSDKLEKDENEKLQGEIKDIRDRYLETIDSLLQLRNKNTALNKSLQTYEDKINELNRKLGIAGKIEIGDFSITARKKTALGNFTSTALARKANSLNICFDVLPNKLASKGTISIYVRIFSPEGEVLTNNAEGSGTFRHPDYKFNVPYTCLSEVEYSGQQVKVCADWNGTENYVSGIYLVELHTDKYSLATTTFSLR